MTQHRELIEKAIAILRKNNVFHTEITQELSDRYQRLRKSVKGKDALISMLFKLTRMLF